MAFPQVQLRGGVPVPPQHHLPREGAALRALGGLHAVRDAGHRGGVDAAVPGGGRQEGPRDRHLGGVHSHLRRTSPRRPVEGLQGACPRLRRRSRCTNGGLLMLWWHAPFIYHTHTHAHARSRAHTRARASTRAPQAHPRPNKYPGAQHMDTVGPARLRRSRTPQHPGTPVSTIRGTQGTMHTPLPTVHVTETARCTSACDVAPTPPVSAVYALLGEAVQQ